MDFVTLSNGVKMPILGFGVYQITDKECERCVMDAISLGYRSIDTAQNYFNEEFVGNAIAKCNVPREELFITTKVWIANFGYEQTRASVLESMKKLQVDYLDLCLLHQPLNDVFGAYRALESLYREGKLRAIGVSNFPADRLVDIACFSQIKPMVNQIEIHPLHQQIEAQRWHQKYGIQMEAWAPLGQGQCGILQLPELKEIGKKYGKTPAQIILRWHIQRGIVSIPKTVHTQRMEENLQVFDFALSEADMQVITALDKKQSAFCSHTDPAEVEWFIQIMEKRKKERCWTKLY